MLEASASNEAHFMPNVPPIVESALQRGGQPLAPEIRRALEPALGQSLEDIHVHQGNEATESAQAVGARAYTAGRDLVFGQGQYQPQTAAGRKLLVHELGHALQQRAAGLNQSSAQKSAGGIMRAPLPGADKPSFSLLSSQIPAPSVQRIGSTIVATFYFGQNYFLLDSRNLAALDKLGDELQFILDPIISIDGYASSEGTDKYNQELSENRRTTVKSLLGLKVMGTATYGGEGHGEQSPAVPEDAKDATELESQRALNRRVTVAVSPSHAAAAPPTQQRRPIDIFRPQPQRPETEEERKKREEEERQRRFKQMLDLGPIKPPQQPSLSEMFWKKVDEKIDEITRKVGVPEKYRGLVKDAAHAAIEKGAEEALDKALDQAQLNSTQKEAIKAAIKAAAQSKL